MEQTLAQVAQSARFDDVAALAVVAASSLAYVTKGRLWAKPNPYKYKLYERPQELSNGLKRKAETRNIAEKLEQQGADVAILWASQSGTAERFAGRLAKDLKRNLSASVILVDISDIEPASVAQIPNNKLAIILASTFGEGDPSDNLHEFYDWLHATNGSDLSHLRYLAFGLGNSNYKHYNLVIDTVAEKLNALGATSLLPVGRADDAKGETEEHFLDWKELVLEIFQSRLGYSRQEVTYEPSLQIVEDGSLELIDLHNGIPQTAVKATSAQSAVYALPIVESRELFSVAEDRNCIHMEVDLNANPELKYKTGDHLGVWPVNPTNEVERLLRLLDLTHKRAESVHIKSLDGAPVKVPSPTTLDALLQHYLEICAPVSRDHIASLATYAPSEDAKRFLMAMSADKDAYHDFLSTNYINLGRLLVYACATEGSWRALPLSLVLEILPAMQPRYYSISSSSVVQARRAAITAVVADTVFPADGERIPGLATNYLLALKGALSAPSAAHPRGLTYSMAGPYAPLQFGHLHAHVRKSTFKLPTMASTPVVMVGAGTGVAPFRAFVQERARVKNMGRDVGPTKLFFGCRNIEQDYLYRDEFSDLQRKLGDVFSLTTAFSRPSNGEEKRYVQDRVLEEAKCMCDLLVEKNAYFYICGSAAMAREVSDTVNSIVMVKQGWNETQMKEFADRQKRQKRWLQDVWG